jgi:hypothetical protein
LWLYNVGKTIINSWCKPFPNGWFIIVLPTYIHGISPVMSRNRSRTDMTNCIKHFCAVAGFKIVKLCFLQHASQWGLRTTSTALCCRRFWSSRAMT